MGIFKGIVHPRYMLVWCVAFIALNAVTIGHLFIYRYITAKGWRTVPIKYKGCVILLVVLALLPVFGIQLAYKDEKEVLKEWSMVRSFRFYPHARLPSKSSKLTANPICVLTGVFLYYAGGHRHPQCYGLR